MYKEELDKKRLHFKYKQNEHNLSKEMLKNKFDNKKYELFRERQKLNDSIKYFEQYKINEMRNIELKENELIYREKMCRNKELLITEKMHSFNDKNNYILSSNENSNKEKEDLILERRELEKDKEDVRIALKRIQIEIDKLNQEKKEAKKEKLNILKLEEEVRVKLNKLNEKKEKIKNQTNNIQSKLGRMGNPQLTYLNNDVNNMNNIYNFNSINNMKYFYNTSPESFPSNRNADNNTIVTNKTGNRNTKDEYFDNLLNNAEKKESIYDGQNVDNNEWRFYYTYLFQKEKKMSKKMFKYKI